MVDSRPTFRDLIERLTHEGVDWVEHDEGDQLHSRKGALLQLREAVFGGMEGGGSSSAFGSKPPVDAAALDLLEEITEQATEALATVSQLPTPYGHAEHYVSLWSAQTTEAQKLHVSVWRERELTPDEVKAGVKRVYRHQIDTTAYDLAQSWLNAIDEFLNPASLREISGECPACGVSETHRKRDGQFVRSTALSFVHDKKTGRTKEAKCAACGATWQPEVFDWLARVVGAAMTLSELLEQYTPADGGEWEATFDVLRKKRRIPLAKLRVSMEEHGIERPVLLGWDGRVWDGMKRLLLAQDLGLTTVPVKLEVEPKTTEKVAAGA